MAEPSSQTRGAWTLCICLLLILAVCYGLLQNGYWYPGNDSELYISLARNIATGNGYQFNSYPVAKVPPGWPLVLAAATKISPSFQFLNALLMAFLLATAAFWYWILHRFTTAGRSFVVLLIAATLFPWYRLTFLLHSDAFFCFLFSAAVLLACQISEGKGPAWRIPLLIVVCAALVAVRWAGVLAWLVVAGALLSNRVKPAWNRRWITLGTSILATVATFMGLRYYLGVHAARELAAAQILADGSSASGTFAEAEPLPPKLETTLAKSYAIRPSGSALEHLRRISYSGAWLSWLFWQPSELGASNKLLGLVVNVMGWVLIICFAVHVVVAARKRQWLFLGALLYAGALCAIWRQPNTRYLIPIAPLLIIGIWQGFGYVLSSRRSLAARAARAAGVVVAVSIVACNVGLLCVNAWLARQEDFYGNYRAGQCKDLIAAADYLNRNCSPDEAILVNSQYVNLNRIRKNSFGFRAASMLTDRRIRLLPCHICPGKPNGELLDWAGQRGFRFYLCRLPVVPWRLGHFRVPWLQEMMTGQPSAPLTPYFELYELGDGGAVRIELAEVNDWPRRVPGL